MFLYAELGTQGSMDAAQRLILRGRFNQKQIENVLRKYIGEFSMRAREGCWPELAVGGLAGA